MSPRWQEGSRATREQVVEEWKIHFRKRFEELMAAEDWVIVQAKADALALELANDVVNIIEQAVRANKGRGVPGE